MTNPQSANNAGAVSMMIPLFMFGILITASESVVVAAITTSSSLQSIPLIFKTNWILFSACFLILNLSLFVLAKHYATKIYDPVLEHINILATTSFILSVTGLWLVAADNGTELQTLVICLISTVVGIKFRKIEWSPLIFALIMQLFVELTIFKIFQLHF